MPAPLLCRVLICCVGLLSFSAAQAVVTCDKRPLAAESSTQPASDAPEVARRLAGVALPGDAVGANFDAYAAAVNDGWQAYVQTFGQPLRAWAVREVRQDIAARTVFYPFSGPDLPSVLAIYPQAAHYVMISDQYATRYFDPFALKDSEQALVVGELAESWARFGRLGFFLTRELNKGGARKRTLSPAMILMAFAVRMGYEVRALRPTCLDAADLTMHPTAARDGRWASVRLELRKDGRDIVIDYIQQDLSNRGLRRPEARALVETLARGPVLLKAASHLPQMPAFSTLRNAILVGSPLVVQDETGLEYDDMARNFNVKLYGEYVGPHRLFKEATNPSLVKAYKVQAAEVRPLAFNLGYEKAAGAAIQVATRK